MQTYDVEKNLWYFGKYLELGGRFMKPGFWVSWRHLGSLKKARFDTAEERALFVQTRLRDGKPALWETNSRGQRIIRRERNESTDRV